MTTRHSTFVAGGIAVALFTGGCLGLPTGDPDAYVAPTRTPSPPPPEMETVVVEALQRTQAVAFRFTVEGDLPDDGGTVKATGAYDPATKVFESTVGSGKDSVHRIVVGTDSYVESRGKWVHLDLQRVKPTALVYFDMTDPTGLVKFTTRVGTAQRDGATGFKGYFDPSGASPEFLPVGAPSIWAIGGGQSPFTVTLDDKGWVTSIAVELKSKDKTLKLLTTFSGHGTPVQVKAPAKKSVVEADDVYYD